MIGRSGIQSRSWNSSAAPGRHEVDTSPDTTFEILKKVIHQFCREILSWNSTTKHLYCVKSQGMWWDEKYNRKYTPCHNISKGINKFYISYKMLFVIPHMISLYINYLLSSRNGNAGKCRYDLLSWVTVFVIGSISVLRDILPTLLIL